MEVRDAEAGATVDELAETDPNAVRYSTGPTMLDTTLPRQTRRYDRTQYSYDRSA